MPALKASRRDGLALIRAASVHLLAATEDHVLVLEDLVGGQTGVAQVPLLALGAQRDVAVQTLADRS